MMTRIEKCLAAYNHVLKILEINNDNYFKRTQILMIVAQSALFVAFAKLLTVKKSTPEDFLLFTKCIALIALFVVTLLGQISALLWVHFGRRQNNVLNLCKSYLRGIENTLMKLDVPSGYWTYESMIAYPETYMGKPGDRLEMNFEIDPCSFPFRLETGEGCRFTKKHCDRFPCKSKEFKIGLTKIERGIAWLLWLFWVVLAVPLGLCASNKLCIPFFVCLCLWIVLSVFGVLIFSRVRFLSKVANSWALRWLIKRI